MNAVSVTLQFVSAEERLPDDDSLKIVICRTQKGVIGWNRAYYSGGFWHGNGSMSGVIAWADLNPEEIAGSF